MQREPPSAGAAAFEDSRQQRERERRQEQSVRSQDVAGQRAAERAAEERRALDAERAAERSRREREAERAATPSWAQSDEIAAAERAFGGAFRSLSAASTVEASGDGGDDDGDDVPMAGLEATNGEEDPGYATERYGADTEAMEE